MSDAATAFTIVMPTRNHARWIESAVRSVLDQDFPGSVELVVFDALSDDATPQILERYRDRLTWRRERDAGQVDAINRGLREARGEIVAWLNSDDLYLPDALARVHAAFGADPALDFVYGDVLEINEDGRIMTPNPFTEDCDAARYFYSHNYICQPTVFVRRRVIERVGFLRDDLRWTMDYEWFTRFFRAGLRGLRLKHFLAANRDHPETKTNSGGLARWGETLSVRTPIPGPPLIGRRSTWIYSLEYVIKSLNAAGWAAPADLPPGKRHFRQRILDRLNARLVRLVQARSFDDIIRRYARDIAPHGANVADLWRKAAPARNRSAAPDRDGPGSPPSAPDSQPSPAFAMPAITPLAPVLERAYPHLVIEMHDALRALLFPKLPGIQGRLPLMAKLIGTGIGEAMYLLGELHASMADAGDICEFGVAQGATSALLANEIRATPKKLWLYDSFAGLPKPSTHDQLKDDIFNLGSIERYEGEMRCDSAEVEFRLAQIGFPKDRYLIRAGWVHETLRDDNGPAAVSFAYVDFDFYEPILHTLDHLDRHLTPNGRIVVDDYDHFSTGAKTAVDEFIQKTAGRFELVKPLPFAGAFCILRRR
ncbi:MAG TPA: glycosyltransferase [Opitutus sp.]|nr:glycosyltransferase [Opitutus sp.]